jgi:hypothetical protein
LSRPAAGPSQRKAISPPVPGYSYTAFGEGVLALDGPGCFVRRLLYARGDVLTPCAGPMEAHHVLSKQWLKRAYPRGLEQSWLGGPVVVCGTLGDLLSDPRNGLLVCNRHHNLAFNRRLVEVGHDELPARARLFAVELGERAVFRLERDYPLAIRRDEESDT